MLAKRIIPTLLVRGRTLVKGERFDGWRSVGHALQGAQVHAGRGVDELCILDIAATNDGRGPDLQMVSEITANCFIPVTVGGGVRTLDDITALLRSGADKVCIGTGYWEEPTLVRRAAQRFGRQAIVVSVDVRLGQCTSRCGSKQVHADPVRAAVEAQNEGAGEILLSCVDRDGTMQGYDIPLIREVSQAVDVPVIASGGCSGYSDMLNAFKAGADACAAGALYAFTDCTPKGAARFLKSQGLEVRT